MTDSAAPKAGSDQVPKEGGLSLEQPEDAVEMTNLAQSQSDDAPAESREPPVPAKDSVVVPATAAGLSEPAGAAHSDADSPDVQPSAKAKGKAPQLLEGTTGTLAALDLDAADEAPASPLPVDAITCRLTLVIVSTGGKWNYRVDAKYLGKRDIEIPESREDGRQDPFSINIKTLKQLLLRDWKPEWGVKPPDSQYMKLISYGKVLEDTWTLIDAKFSEQSENPVHVSVTPIDMIHEDEGEAKNLRDKGSAAGRGRNRDENTGCCVIL